MSCAALDCNPCEWLDAAEKLLDSGLKILALNRRVNRQFSNMDQLQRFFSGFQLENRSISILHHSGNGTGSGNATNPNPNPNIAGTPPHRLSTTHFEGKSFHEQVREMQEADVLLSIHGAAMANIVFMKPCSIVVEVFPWVYHSPEFYSGLAKRAGLIYFDWQEQYAHTELYLDKDSEAKCRPVFEKVAQLSQYDTSPGASPSLADLKRANEACFNVPNCRMCAQYFAIKGEC